MDNKNKYEDFIGEQIEVIMPVANLFMFKSAYEVLKKALSKKITEQLSYRNGLLCSFNAVTVSTVENNGVKVSGLVAQCEVDC